MEKENNVIDIATETAEGISILQRGKTTNKIKFVSFMILLAIMVVGVFAATTYTSEVTYNAMTGE